jgi:hypothetical protein
MLKNDIVEANMWLLKNRYEKEPTRQHLYYAFHVELVLDLDHVILII